MRLFSRKKLREVRSIIALGIFLTLLLAGTQFSNGYARQLLDRLDLLIYDLRFNLLLPYAQEQQGKKGQAAAQRIVIIDIDERSLKEVGHWPWSRKVLATLVDKLAAAGVVSITFDVVFSEPEPNMATEIAATQQAAPVAQHLLELAPQFDYDGLMAGSLGKIDVTLGYILHKEVFLTGGMPPSNIDVPPEVVQRTSTDRMLGYTTNIPVLQKSARSQGFINGDPDADGIVRRAPLVLRYGDQLYPSLALQTVMTYLLLDTVKPNVINDGNVAYLQSVPLGDKLIHTDEKGQMLVPYRGHKGSFPYIPAADVLSDKVDPAVLSGSIAMVGTSAIGLVDLRTTPVGAMYPGIETQATIVDALLRGDVPFKPDIALGINMLAILLLGVLLALIMPFVGPAVMSLLGLGMLVVVAAGNVWLWQVKGLDMPVSGPLLTVMTLYVINISFGFFTAAQQKDQIKGMFGQYVAPAHIDRLLDDPAALSFEGESKKMTVLFSDIRSFTNMSETLSASDLKSLLNRYFTPMTEIIFEQQGTIDKYVGDMIMAFWGAPLDDPEHEKHAVMAAMLMQKKQAELRDVFRESGLPPIYTGIGINTGHMNVGDMGSSYRRAYTVLGDAVNLGARLESITKFYGADILVSEFTYAAVQEDFIWREVDYMQVKGKKEPIRVYEPLALRDEADEILMRHVYQYQLARASYLARRWEEAHSLFSALAAEAQRFRKLCDIYKERIKNYRTEQLPDDWCGVWQHTDK
ncbi:MAG TPA: adenylate/guanylate cyclase domain-containing protein [Pseudomonadales bacterium]|nr:adenylate/guanylate cyclase domain-containing protein [Pseudomonadales bacterium]